MAQPLLVEPLQKMLGSALLGVILVMDSSQPTYFREARAIFAPLTWLPVVIAANPRNPAQAWPLEDLRIGLKLKAQDVLMTCDPTRHFDTVKVVLKLAKALPDSPFVQTLKTVLS